MSKLTEKRLELEWRRGFYCAVSTLVRAHGCTVEAEDVLKCSGTKNFRGIDEFDREALRPAFAEIARKRR